MIRLASVYVAFLFGETPRYTIHPTFMIINPEIWVQLTSYSSPFRPAEIGVNL